MKTTLLYRKESKEYVYLLTVTVLLLLVVFESTMLGILTAIFFCLLQFSIFFGFLVVGLAISKYHQNLRSLNNPLPELSRKEVANNLDAALLSAR